MVSNAAWLQHLLCYQSAGPQARDTAGENIWPVSLEPMETVETVETVEIVETAQRQLSAVRENGTRQQPWELAGLYSRVGLGLEISQSGLATCVLGLIPTI